VRPILSFSCSDKVSYILTTTSYFDNLQFAIFDAGSSHYHFNQGHNEGERGAQFPGGPVTMGRRMTTGRRKVTIMSQALSSIPYIYFQNLSGSNVGSPNLLLAPDAI